MSPRPSETATRRPLGLAVLGCGRIAAEHSGTLKRVAPHVRLAFASRDRDRATAFAARHGGRALASYEQAMSDGDVDAVLVATPPSTHLELAVAALLAGRDVIVEKPAFLSTRQFDEAAGAARSAGRRLMVAENYFYKPLRRRLEDWLQKGSVGHPLFIAVDATKSQPFDGWRADPAIGGRPLIEGGIHWIDLMANLGLPVQRVQAVAAGPDPAAERSVAMTFTYEGGTAGVLSLSWEAHARLGGARLSHLHGTDGTVTFESNGAFAALRGRRRRLWMPDPREASGFAPMWRDLTAALGAGAMPAFDLARARRDIALVEEARASIPRSGAGRRG